MLYVKTRLYKTEQKQVDGGTLTFTKDNTAQLRLRASTDLLSQYCRLKNLKYIQYSCVFQTLSCAKLSRRFLLPNCAVMPKKYTTGQIANWDGVQPAPGYVNTTGFPHNHIVENQNSHTGFAMPEYPGYNGPARNECWLLKVNAATRSIPAPIRHIRPPSGISVSRVRRSLTARCRLI